MRRVVVVLIRFYRRFLSPLKGPTCIYYPTCSEYTLEAVERYGVLTGLWLGLRRVLRCHPFHQSGYDPVPDLHRGRLHVSHPMEVSVDTKKLT
ncbi:MAG: membrane protein insertion efficiency factor YidD [Caldisericota bacterium]|jgi:putative membrane protein insertion efficiency factor|nr:membrane protein insertion efficiency factor YidD [Caldisericota bacterium]